MIKKMISALCAMIFCLGLLPIAAYAVEGGHTEDTVASAPTTLAAMPDGQVLYVGGVSISFTGYWTQTVRETSPRIQAQEHRQTAISTMTKVPIP